MHYLPEVTNDWFRVDLEACERLRVQLDYEGGQDVAIDYPLLISNSVLNDVAQRRALIEALRSLPIDSIWLRVSGFGADATAASIRKYISAARDFHTLGKPVISDCVGGLAAQAILAFGAGAGIAHGVAAKERFSVSGWHKPARPPDPNRKRGTSTYSILLPGLDRLLKPDQAQTLIDASEGRRLLSCNNRNCCPTGFDDTKRDPKGHYLRQRAFQCEAISNVPEFRRAQDFLDRTLAVAARTARQVAKLRVQDAEIMAITAANADRLDRLCIVLQNLKEAEAVSTHSAPFPSPSTVRTARKGDRG